MVTFFAGQLPKEFGKLVNLKEFNVYGNNIEGQLSIRSERLRILLTFTFSAGELPKELGELANLKHFDARNNKLQGGLSTRTERSNLRD